MTKLWQHEKKNALRDAKHDCEKEGRIHFDRSICACGSMHYYCECGEQVDECRPETWRICDDGYACLAPDCVCPSPPENEAEHALRRLSQRTFEEPESVLQEADRITDSQRRDKYGPPAVDFAKVQGMAKALWGRGPENEAEHALYLVFVKLAREQHSHSRDNVVDAIGYLKLYWEIISGQE